jgi:hypothetical protein
MEAALKLLSLDPPLALLYRSAGDLYVFEPKRCSRVFGHSRMDIVVQFGVLGLQEIVAVASKLS